MTNYQKRKEKNDEYRSKIMRFTFQLSLGDTEVREWFEQQPEKGAYLKDLILRDKAERLGYREQKSAEPDKAGDYEIIQSIRMGGRVLLMGFNPKDETYMTCYQQYNFLGETMYPEALACKSYLEIAETFLNRLQAQVEKVKAFRAARNVPYAVLPLRWEPMCSAIYSAWTMHWRDCPSRSRLAGSSFPICKRSWKPQRQRYKSRFPARQS